MSSELAKRRRLKFNGGHWKRITVHLLNLLFVTAVGMSLLLGTTAFTPVSSLQQAQNSTSCDYQPRIKKHKK